MNVLTKDKFFGDFVWTFDATMPEAQVDCPLGHSCEENMDPGIGLASFCIAEAVVPSPMAELPL